jgi:outer membrane protein OmpA-like peptidoglycan-associated protein
MALPLLAAQQAAKPADQSTPSTSTPSTTASDKSMKSDSQKTGGARSFASGQKAEIEGIILKREPDSILLRTNDGMDVKVALTNTTAVKEKKSNPFRGGKNYATTQLLRGLGVEVKGRGDASGNLIADQIKFKDDDLRVASSIESRVTPVEGRLTESETRLGQAETNAQRLSGQVEELASVSNAARGGAKAAQETADQAKEIGEQAKQRAEAAHTGIKTTNERISSLDDYDVRSTETVTFKVGSAVLSDDAKAALDKLAESAKTDKGFMIEITGFASSDGSEAANRRLSQRRADAVVQYLGENHNIPLRRLITPFGYGEKQPVADNKTREGRQQNRRVEVKILVNKGLTASSPAPGN